jgi:hypothetical protein
MNGCTCLSLSPRRSVSSIRVSFGWCVSSPLSSKSLGSYASLVLLPFRCSSRSAGLVVVVVEAAGVPVGEDDEDEGSPTPFALEPAVVAATRLRESVEDDMGWLSHSPAAGGDTARLREKERNR